MTVLLDANLLLLLVVGGTDPRLISKHKRLSAFSSEDFLTLERLLSQSRQIVVTPNTLTETSNLAGYIAEPARSQIYLTLRTLTGAPHVAEIFVPSRVATQRPEFVRLGLTDASLLDASMEPALLLTVDLDLYLTALKQGRRAQNFNYLRKL